MYIKELFVVCRDTETCGLKTVDLCRIYSIIELGAAVDKSKLPLYMYTAPLHHYTAPRTTTLHHAPLYCTTHHYTAPMFRYCHNYCP